MEAIIGVVMLTLLGVVLLVMIGNIYGAVLRRRYLHRERMVMLDKGLTIPDELLVEPEPASRRPGNHLTALNGIIWTGIGLGLLLTAKAATTNPEIGNDMRGFVAFLGLWAFPALFVGLGLLVYAWIIREKKK